MMQSRLDWEFGKGKPRINPERLKKKILQSFFDAGFVIDFGNGIVAETYEEYEQIWHILREIKNKGSENGRK